MGFNWGNKKWRPANVPKGQPKINQSIEELLKGNNPTQIASITGFKRADVLVLIDEWKEVVRNDHTARDRAKEAISGADQHYAMLIKEAWKTVEDADQAGQLNVKATALKLIADIEGKRIYWGGLASYCPRIDSLDSREFHSSS